MNSVYDVNAPKRATNLTVNEDLLKRAKAQKINISSVLESALVEALRQRQEQDWKAENKESIRIYNKKIEEIGLFNEGLRSV